MINKISIYDDKEFNTEVEVLNECFKKEYGGFQRGFCYVNYEKTAGAWFPQIAIEENGQLRPQSSSDKEMVNTISSDGMRMEMYSLADITFGHGNEIHFTFAKFKGHGFKYVGTFLRDSLNSTEEKVVFVRVSDHINLDKWSKNEYVDNTDETIENLCGVYGSWQILNQNMAFCKTDYAMFDSSIVIDDRVNWFFNVDRLEWADYLPCPLFYNDELYISKIVQKNGKARIELDKNLVRQIELSDETGFEYLIFGFVCDNKTGGYVFSIKGQGEEKEKEDPYTSEVYSTKEGRRIAVYTTKYERNSKNRNKAIELHGTKCSICGFDFEKTYGDIGKGFIEVHHVKPLSEIDEEMEINPETDLVCVCANCHRMIHKKHNGVYSVDEMRIMLRDDHE